MLKIHVTNMDCVAVLRLNGRLVNGETEILRHAADSLADVRGVKLDFARVTTVDAHGLGVLLELRERTQAKGIRFELINVTEMVGRVFAMTRLDSVFQISSGIDFFPAVSRSRQASMPVLASCA